MEHYNHFCIAMARARTLPIETQNLDRIRDHPRRPRRAPSNSHDDDDHAPGLASSKETSPFRARAGATHWMHRFICLRVRRHTAKFPAIFRTKKAGSSDTGVAERTHENALSRTRLVPASFRGHMYNWKYEFSKAPQLSCREMISQICPRIRGRFPSIDSWQGRKNGCSSTTSPVAVVDLQSRNSIHCICPIGTSADKWRKMSSALVWKDNGSGPVQGKQR